jgi:cytidylate kinase
VTANLDYVFHVRLVASLDNRIKYVQERDGLSRKTAETLVKGEDLGRRRFLRRYFGKKIDDPLLYHLGINLDLISHEEAARLIALAVLPQTNLSARRL